MTGTAGHVEAHLSDARQARGSGDLSACAEALERAGLTALELADDHPLRQVVAWRRSKVAFDRDAPLQALHAIEEVLAGPDPFAHYPNGLNAAEPLAAAVWDAHGYGFDAIDRLWRAYSATHRQRGDPFLAAMGDVQRGWQLACSGQLSALSKLLDAYGALTPKSFGDGPHRHARAEDAPTSVFWIQMDLARITLRAATWSRDRSLAHDALEVYEDALSEAGETRLSVYWFVECAGRAALAFGWSDLSDVVDAWWRTAPALDHPRAPLHQALALAAAHHDTGQHSAAIDAYADAVHQAHRLHAGPEWEVDARLWGHEAARSCSPAPPASQAWLTEAAHRIEVAHLHVFAPWLDTLRGQLTPAG